MSSHYKRTVYHQQKHSTLSRWVGWAASERGVASRRRRRWSACNLAEEARMLVAMATDALQADGQPLKLRPPVVTSCQTTF